MTNNTDADIRAEFYKILPFDKDDYTEHALEVQFFLYKKGFEQGKRIENDRIKELEAEIVAANLGLQRAAEKRKTLTWELAKTKNTLKNYSRNTSKD